MTKLQKFANITSKTLLNTRGRLSFCTCCCPGLPSRLCLHVAPTNNEPDGSPNSFCGEQDEDELEANPGPNDPYVLTGNFPDANSCEDWATLDNTQLTAQTCWTGGSDPNHPPSIFGTGMHLYCRPVNNFAADICFVADGQSDYPDNPGGCTQILKEVQPISVNACEALPGEFLIDFGNFQPMGDNSDRTSHGTNVSGTASACSCDFHIWVDECDDPTLQTLNPVWMYPAEAAGAIEEFHAAFWFWEHFPNVGTPLLKQRPTMKPPTGQRLGVGTRLARKLARANFNYEEPGCSCFRLMNQMNTAGPHRILNDLDHWTERVQKSAKSWFRKEWKKGRIFKQVLRPLPYLGTKYLIRKCCNEEIAGKV